MSSKDSIVLLTREYEQRYAELNRTRIKRARDAMSQAGSDFFARVALYLHFNHPLIPGYSAGDVPHGICGFEPNEEQYRYLYSLSSSYGTFERFVAQDESILALYCMGSTSSIGQGIFSDIDCWVCVSHHLSARRIELLEKKCAFITEMARKRGVEINFFIVKDNKFKEKNIEIADADSCGSAQHLFLLDEFYRSAICLAGKKLVWMLVPEFAEDKYEEYVSCLFNKGIINRQEWFDLGTCSGISPSEYYGSALWLMYKGIDSPFKAVLKIMLMEVYSSEYPKTQLLSIKMRSWMQNNDGYSLKLDSYYMVYEKITKYLKSLSDEKRTSLLRFCFYQKLADGIKHMENPGAISYRRSVIRSLIESWGWREEDRTFIENKQKWRIREIRRIYNLIFNTLMQSYQALLNFGIKNNVTDAIRLVDISVLSRKLYIAFDEYPGKVKRYNLNIGKVPAERNLAFVEVVNSRMCRDGWYVYNMSLEPKEIIGQKPLAYFQSVGNAVVSASLNNVVGKSTHIFVHAIKAHVTEKKIISFCEDLKGFFSPSVHITNSILLEPGQVKKVAFFVNFANDITTSAEYNHVSSGTLGVNVFSSGINNKSMVSSLDVVMVNNWNEIICLSYEGYNCLVDCINDLDKFFPRGYDMTQVETKVFNLSAHMWVYIANQMEDLVAKLVAGISTIENSYLELNINGEDYILNFGTAHTSICLKYIYDSFKIGVGFEDLLEEQLPPIVRKNLSHGCIQFFFAHKDNGLIDIYELDENQNVTINRNFTGDLSALIKSINLYYSKKFKTQNKKSDSTVNYHQYFNLPQFFEFNEQASELRPCLAQR